MTRATVGKGIPDNDADAALEEAGPEYGTLTMRLYYALEVLKGSGGELWPKPIGPFRYTLARAWSDAEPIKRGGKEPAIGSLVLIFDPSVPSALEEWRSRTSEAEEEARQWQQ